MFARPCVCVWGVGVGGGPINCNCSPMVWRIFSKSPPDQSSTIFRRLQRLLFSSGLPKLKVDTKFDTFCRFTNSRFQHKVSQKLPTFNFRHRCTNAPASAHKLRYYVLTFSIHINQLKICPEYLHHGVYLIVLSTRTHACTFFYLLKIIHGNTTASVMTTKNKQQNLILA